MLAAAIEKINKLPSYLQGMIKARITEKVWHWTGIAALNYM
jgi:hypothetical protein